MKNFILAFASHFLRRYLTRAAVGPSPMPNLLEPVKHAVTDILKKYAVLAACTFLFSLYFIGGSLILITAIANAYDVAGQFRASNLFYAGLGLTVLSGGALAWCLVAFRRAHKKPAEQLQDEYYAYEAALPQPSPPAAVKIGQAILAGIYEGWTKEGRVTQPHFRREPLSPVVLAPDERPDIRVV